MKFKESLSLLHKRGLSYAILRNSIPFLKNVDYHLQFMEFISLLQTRGLSNEVCESFPFSNTVDYHMQFLKFMEFLSLFQKRGLSYAIYGISIPSPKTWSVICNFQNFFAFSKNVDYHMQFLEFLSLIKKVDFYKQFLEFLSLRQKC